MKLPWKKKKAKNQVSQTADRTQLDDQRVALGDTLTTASNHSSRSTITRSAAKTTGAPVDGRTGIPDGYPSPVPPPPPPPPVPPPNTQPPPRQPEVIRYTAPAVLGVPTSTCPSGTLSILVQDHKTCPGFSPPCSVISLLYKIPSGVQQAYHYHPGAPFSGTERIAYLPNNEAGRRLLARFKSAWTSGLIFTVGYSQFFRQHDATVWAAKITHKVDLQGGGEFAYPDPSYIDKCNQEMDVQGVPPADALLMAQPPPTPRQSPDQAEGNRDERSDSPHPEEKRILALEQQPLNSSPATPAPDFPSPSPPTRAPPQQPAPAAAAFPVSSFEEQVHTYTCPQQRVLPITRNPPMGIQPSGRMRVRAVKEVCPGFDLETQCLQLRFDIEPGVQKAYQPTPGLSFNGTTRLTYLPYNQAGVDLLNRLVCAWKHGLIFTIGTSRTSGKTNVVVWSDAIPHKTTLNRGAFGYPDPTYLPKCNEALDALQVPAYPATGGAMSNGNGRGALKEPPPSAHPGTIQAPVGPTPVEGETKPPALHSPPPRAAPDGPLPPYRRRNGPTPLQPPQPGNVSQTASATERATAFRNQQLTASATERATEFHSQQRQGKTQTASSSVARAVPLQGETAADFVLVEGDLVALPPPNNQNRGTTSGREHVRGATMPERRTADANERLIIMESTIETVAQDVSPSRDEEIVEQVEGVVVPEQSTTPRPLMLLSRSEPVYTEEPPMPARFRPGDSYAPLSRATPQAETVYNDMLKVVVVGSSCGAEKSALACALGGGSETAPRRKSDVPIDLQERVWSDAGFTFKIWNAKGSDEPGVQSLFVSNESLNILVWDLATQKPCTNPVPDDDSLRGLYPGAEKEPSRADKELECDMREKVVKWVERISRIAPRSAILPVAVLNARSMDCEEVERRRDKLEELLMSDINELDEERPQIILNESHQIHYVDFFSDPTDGIEELRRTLTALATECVLEHVGAVVSPGAVTLYRHLKQSQEDLIFVDKLLGFADGADSAEATDQVHRTLQILASAGEIFYFGNGHRDTVLSTVVILDSQWLLRAVSRIVHADENTTTNLEETFKALNGKHLLECPLLSTRGVQQMWDDLGAPVLRYLEHALVFLGLFVPFGTEEVNQPTGPFFVPSLLRRDESESVWEYYDTNAWSPTLCFSWLFESDTPLDLFEQVAVATLRAACSCVEAMPPAIAATIKKINCRKGTVRLEIGTGRSDCQNGEAGRSVAELFVSLVDHRSANCVSSHSMEPGNKRLVVSGRGPDIQNLFQGGLQAILDSIQSLLAPFNARMQVVCPECLAHNDPSVAATWDWESFRAVAKMVRHHIVCSCGHRLDGRLLMGPNEAEDPDLPAASPEKPIRNVIGGFVMVGLWDREKHTLCRSGSGFVADERLGLIVTTTRPLPANSRLRPDKREASRAQIVLGVVATDEYTTNAVWRYFAEMVREDRDVCVLRITARMEKDIEGDNLDTATPGSMFHGDKVKRENLVKLTIKETVQVDEPVLMLRYWRARERDAAAVSRGHVCDHFEGSYAASTSSSTGLMRTAVAVRCSTVTGQEGATCVDDQGCVVGIVASVNSSANDLCYLVPGAQLKEAVERATQSRPRFTVL